METMGKILKDDRNIGIGNGVRRAIGKVWLRFVERKVLLYLKIVNSWNWNSLNKYRRENAGRVSACSHDKP
jgi:hypothetical protein